MNSSRDYGDFELMQDEGSSVFSTPVKGGGASTISGESTAASSPQSLCSTPGAATSPEVSPTKPQPSVVLTVKCPVCLRFFPKEDWRQSQNKSVIGRLYSFTCTFAG